MRQSWRMKLFCVWLVCAFGLAWLVGCGSSGGLSLQWRPGQISVEGAATRPSE